MTGSRPFCADCPDHEACASGWPCHVVKQTCDATGPESGVPCILPSGAAGHRLGQHEAHHSNGVPGHKAVWRVSPAERLSWGSGVSTPAVRRRA